MNTLKLQLAEKREHLLILIQEIRVLEEKILEEEWKGKPECSYSGSEIEEKCPWWVQTYRGMLYCKNPNCHK